MNTDVAGRHGVITHSSTSIMQTLFAPNASRSREYHHSYSIQTDSGATTSFARVDDFDLETGAAPAVIPDPIGPEGEPETASHLVHLHGVAVSYYDRHRRSADRRKRPDLRAKDMAEANRELKRAQDIKATLADWSAAHPAEAAVVEGLGAILGTAKATPSAPAVAASSTPAATAISADGITTAVVEQFHSKRQRNVYIVTMSGRVSPEEYTVLLGKAKRLGGKYSKEWKPTKSPAGFMFNDRKDADAFKAQVDARLGAAPAVAPRPVAPSPRTEIADVASRRGRAGVLKARRAMLIERNLLTDTERTDLEQLFWAPLGDAPSTISLDLIRRILDDVEKANPVTDQAEKSPIGFEVSTATLVPYRTPDGKIGYRAEPESDGGVQGAAVPRPVAPAPRRPKAGLMGTGAPPGGWADGDLVMPEGWKIPRDLADRLDVEPSIPVPGHPNINYAIYRRKPGATGDIFKVIMSRQEGGFFTVDGTGMTPGEAFRSAARQIYDRERQDAAKKQPAAPDVPAAVQNNVESQVKFLQGIAAEGERAKAMTDGGRYFWEWAKSNSDRIDRAVKGWQLFLQGVPLSKWNAIEQVAKTFGGVPDLAKMKHEALAWNDEGPRKAPVARRLVPFDPVKNPGETESPTAKLSDAKQARLAEIQAKMRAKLGGKVMEAAAPYNGQASMPYDAEMVTLASEMAGLYAESGVRTFADFTLKVNADMPDVWDGVKRYLHGAWTSAGASFPDVEEVSRKAAADAIAMIDEASAPALHPPVEKATISSVSPSAPRPVVPAARKGRSDAKVQDDLFAVNGADATVGNGATGQPARAARPVVPERRTAAGVTPESVGGRDGRDVLDNGLAGGQRGGGAGPGSAQGLDGTGAGASGSDQSDGAGEYGSSGDGDRVGAAGPARLGGLGGDGRLGPGPGVRPGGDAGGSVGDDLLAAPGAVGSATQGGDPGARSGVVAGAGASAEAGKPGRVDAGDGVNFRLLGVDLVSASGVVAKARENLDAIRTLKRVQAEGRSATGDERAVLARYIGWGHTGLKNKMFPLSGRDAVMSDDRSDVDTFKGFARDLAQLLTPEEYDTARQSTQYAHYTSPEVINAMWSAARRLGFRGGRVLEPGSGVGRFVGMVPAELGGKVAFTGIEMDGISAGIAAMLYPQSDMRHQNFVEFPYIGQVYDLAIGNPPFSSRTVTADRRYYKEKLVLHDYFIRKSMDMVKPGGLMILVTSHGTMDKKGEKARELIAGQADLIGAIRLPQTAFKQDAGTEVVTDILFLRKREDGAEPGGEKWTGLAEVKTPAGVETWVNEYYANHPEMVLGTHSMAGKMRFGGDQEYTVMPLEGDIGTHLARAVDRLPEADVPEADPAPITGADDAAAALKTAPAGSIDGGFVVGSDGELYLSDNGKMTPIKAFTSRKAESDDAESSTVIYKAKKSLAVIRHYIPLREAYRNVLSLQRDGTDDELKGAQKMLTRAYNLFKLAHGSLQATIRTDRTDPLTGEVTTSVRFVLKSILSEDTFAGGVMSLEEVNMEGDVVGLSKLFTERVAGVLPEPKIETASDALTVVLHNSNKPDLNEVAKLRGKSVEEVEQELGHRVFRDHETGAWVVGEKYLSGNVREKLKEARAKAAKDPAYARNVAALEAAQPADLPISRIKLNLGMPIIPSTDIERFMKEVGGENVSVKLNDALGRWNAEMIGAGAWARAAGNVSKFGTPLRSAAKILEAALNGRPIVVQYKDKDDNIQTNQEATAAANEKVSQLRAAWAVWVWSEPERASRLERAFNDTMNVWRKQNWDGSHMSFPGLSKFFTPYPHQTGLVWRVLQQGNTYAAHDVGLGKTLAAAMTVMELRRLGQARKCMIVVPNAMLAQWNGDFLNAYPAARILLADEEQFDRSRRQRFLGRVANSDFDAVIITHSAFKLLPIKPETEAAFVERELEKYRKALLSAGGGSKKGKGRGDPAVKDIENAIESMEDKLTALRRMRRDKGLTWDDLGIDHLTVDEAHNYRKLRFATQRQMKGIDSKGSEAAWDLYMKSQTIQQRTPGRGLLFLSGTPVVNTMGEVFSIQRMMQPQALKAVNLEMFDNWVSSFGREETEYEKTAGVGYQAVTRMASWHNMTMLSGMWQQIADYRQYDDLPYMNGRRPAPAGGVIQPMTVPETDTQQRYRTGILQERIDKIKARRGKPQPGDDIMLSVITDGIHAALDERFINPNKAPNPETKIERMISDVARIYREGQADKCTQLIFMDKGLPDMAERRGFSTYLRVRDGLIAAGIPANEIVFFNDWKTSDKKKRLQQLFNVGDIRVMIGSMQAMGTGLNVQKRLYATHFATIPWYPALVEQAAGRILRQGNMYAGDANGVGRKDVILRAWATAGTLEEYMWGLNKTKSLWIRGFFAGALDEMGGELDSGSDNYAMLAAMSSADPRVQKLAKLQAELAKLQMLERAHLDTQASLYNRIRAQRSSADNNRKYIEKLRAWPKAPETKGDLFSINVGNASYSKRGEASEALFKAVKAVWDVNDANPEDVPIGSFGDSYPFTASSIWSPSDGKRQWFVSMYVRHGDGKLERFKTARFDPVFRPEGITPHGLLQALEYWLKWNAEEIETFEKAATRADEDALEIESKIEPWTRGDEAEKYRNDIRSIQAAVIEDSKQAEIQAAKDKEAKRAAGKNDDDGGDDDDGSSVRETPAEYRAGPGVLKASNATLTAPGRGAQSWRVAEPVGVAYHGTPHTFEPEPGAPLGRVKKEKVGTGEGAASYGWGVLYAAQEEAVAAAYKGNLGGLFYDRLNLSSEGDRDVARISERIMFGSGVGGDVARLAGVMIGRKMEDGEPIGNPPGSESAAFRNAWRVLAGRLTYRPGNIYHIEITADTDDFMDWDLPLRQQSDNVRQALFMDYGAQAGSTKNPSGSTIYKDMAQLQGSYRGASEYLASLGIRGIRYADQASRKNVYGVSRIWENAKHPARLQWSVTSPNGYNEAFYTESEAIADAAARNAEKTYNYVVFNESDIRVVGRNGETLTAGQAVREADAPYRSMETALRSQFPDPQGAKATAAVREALVQMELALAAPDAPYQAAARAVMPAARGMLEKLADRREKITAALKRGLATAMRDGEGRMDLRFSRAAYDFPNMPFNLDVKSGLKVESPRDVAALAWKLRTPMFERFIGVALDKNHKVLKGRVISVGLLDSAPIHPREAFGWVPAGTVDVLFTHNHPSGDSTPSDADLRVTRQLVDAGKVLGYRVIDHITTNGEYRSMRNQGSVTFDGREAWLNRYEQEPKYEQTALADWELVRYDQRPHIGDDKKLREIVEPMNKHAGEGKWIHVAMLDTKNRLLSVDRISGGRSVEETVKRVQRSVIGYGGVAGYIVSFSWHSNDVNTLATAIAKTSKTTGMRVIEFMDHNYGSAREAGALDVDGSFRKVSAWNGPAVYPDPDEIGAGVDRMLAAEVAEKRSPRPVAPKARLTVAPAVRETVGMDRRSMQAEAKRLGLPATGTTPEIQNLLRIARTPATEWTESDLTAIAPHLSLHQDMRDGAAGRVDGIMRDGLSGGQTDSFGNFVSNGSWTWANAIQGHAYLFIQGALKFKDKGSAWLAPGNKPIAHLLAVTPIQRGDKAGILAAIDKGALPLTGAMVVREDPAPYGISDSDGPDWGAYAELAQKIADMERFRDRSIEVTRAFERDKMSRAAKEMQGLRRRVTQIDAERAAGKAMRAEPNAVAAAEFRRVTGADPKRGETFADLLLEAVSIGREKGKAMKAKRDIRAAVRDALNGRVKRLMASSAMPTNWSEVNAARNVRMLEVLAQVEEGFKGLPPGEVNAAKKSTVRRLLGGGKDIDAALEGMGESDYIDLFREVRSAVERDLRAYYRVEIGRLFGGRPTQKTLPNGTKIAAKTEGIVRAGLSRMTDEPRAGMQKLIDETEWDSINSLQWDEMRSLVDAAKGLLAMDALNKREILEGHATRRADLAAMAAKEIEFTKPVLPEAASHDPRKGGLNQRLAWWRAATATRAMLLSGDPDGATSTVLAKNLLAANRRQLDMEAAANQEMDAKLKGLGYERKDLLDMDYVLETVDFPNGAQITMTRGEMMTVYGMTLDDDAREKLLANGFRPSRFRNDPSRTIRGEGANYDERIDASAANVAAVVGLLTPRERTIVEWMVNERSREWARLGNETSREIGGVSLFGDHPHITLTQAIDREAELPDVDDPANGFRRHMVDRMGLTKERQAHSHPLLIRPLLSIYRMQARDMSTYVAWAVSYRDAISLVSRGPAKAAIVQRWGSGVLGDVKDTLAYLTYQKGHTDHFNGLQKFLQGRERAAATFILGARLTTIALNRYGGSIMLAARLAAEGGPGGKALATKFLGLVARPQVGMERGWMPSRKAVRDKLLQRGYFWDRWGRHAFRVFGQLSSQRMEMEEAEGRTLSLAKLRRRQAWRDASTWLLSGMQKAEVANAIDLYNVLTEAGWDDARAMDAIETWTRETQNPSTPLEQSGQYTQIRTGGLGVALPFLGQPSVLADQLLNQYLRAKHGRKWSTFVILALATMLSALFTVALRAFVRRAGKDQLEDPDEKETVNTALDAIGQTADVFMPGTSRAIEAIGRPAAAISAGSRGLLAPATATDETLLGQSYTAGTGILNAFARWTMDGDIEEAQGEKLFLDVHRALGLTLGLPTGGIEQAVRVGAGLVGEPLGKREVAPKARKRTTRD